MVIQHRMAFLFCFHELQDTSDVQVCSGHRGSIKSLCFSTDSFQLACYRPLECIACCKRSMSFDDPAVDVVYGDFVPDSCMTLRVYKWHTELV